MKKLYGVVLLLALTVSPALADYDSINRKIGESGYSPVLHVAVGAAVSGITYNLLPEDWNPIVKGLTSVAVSSIVGFSIESLDRNFDNGDFYDYIGGGCVGVLIGGTF